MRVRRIERRELDRIWSIDRTERIERVYRIEDDALVLRDELHDLAGWPAGTPEKNAPILLDCFERGGDFWGAFEGGDLVGVAVLESRVIGHAGDTLQLVFLHVSRGVRGTGIGRALFDTAARRARELGARRLYVSATPSENTVRFYLGRGCRLATDVDPALFALEPDDIHLDLELSE